MGVARCMHMLSPYEIWQDSAASRAYTWNVGEMAKTHHGLSCDCRMSGAGPFATCNLKEQS